MLKTKIIKKYDSKKLAVMTHQTEMLEEEASFALSCIDKWGMNSIVPDGEDSTGRSKIRMATPQELVNRAFETAQLAYAHARESGLIVSVCDIDELFPEPDEQ